MLSTILSRFQCAEKRDSLNDHLKKSGVKLRFRTTPDSPTIMVRNPQRFEDGSQVRSLGLRVDSAKDWEKALTLICEMSRSDDPLSLLERPKNAPVQFTPWTCLTAQLAHFLDQKGLKWRGQAYDRHIRQINQFKGKVHPAKLQRWVEEADSSSRDRQDRLATISYLLKSTELEVDSKWLMVTKELSRYDPDSSIKPQDVPSDAHVQSFIDNIPNREWQCAFGLQAVYGLRPHEIFYVTDLPDEDGFIEVDSQKVKGNQSGWRTVMPRRTDWIDRWNLREATVPAHDPDMSAKDLGHRVSTELRRYRIKGLVRWSDTGRSYDLRHAYAAACHTQPHLMHLEVREIARNMGHTEKIHTKHYTRWIEKKNLKAAAKRRSMGL